MMLRVLALLAMPLLITAGAHAAPQNPCDHYLPTGEALPRPDTVRGSPVIHDDPTWRGHRGAASSRPIATERDCELRYDDPHLLDSCKATLAKKTAREEELATSVWLNAEQMQGFVAGKTITYAARPGTDSANASEPQLSAYYQPNGEAFVLVGPRARAWRGRWLVKGDSLCLVDSGVGCGRLRRITSGETVWVGATGEFTGTPAEGDSKNAVRQVSQLFPYAAPLPVPDGLENVAHPVMGW